MDWDVLQLPTGMMRHCQQMMNVIEKCIYMYYLVNDNVLPFKAIL
jgi:hypothetical protein